MRRFGLVTAAVAIWSGGFASQCLAQAPYLVQIAPTGALRPGAWPENVPAICVKHVAANTSRCLSRIGEKWVVTTLVNAAGPFHVELPMEVSGEPAWVAFGEVAEPVDELKALSLANKAIVAAKGVVPAPATPPLSLWEWLERASNFNSPPPSSMGESLVLVFNCLRVRYQGYGGTTDAFEDVGGQQIPMMQWSEVVSFKVGGGLVSPPPARIEIVFPADFPSADLRCTGNKEVDFSAAVEKFVTTGDRWLRSVVLDALNDNFLRGALIELIKGDPASREALLRIAATEEAARSQTRDTLLHLLRNDAAFKDEVRQILGVQ